VIAEASYDADHFRDPIEARGAGAVIPGSTSRARRVGIDRRIYKERHLVACCFSKLKDFRRIATVGSTAPDRQDRRILPQHGDARGYHPLASVSVNRP
jgi:transposase